MLDHRSLYAPDIGTLLDESFWLFRKNFMLFVAIGAALLGPYLVLSLILGLLNPEAQPRTPDSFSEFLRTTFISMGRPEQRQGVLGWLYMLVCQPLAAAAIVVAITERYGQRDVEASTSITTALPYLIPLSIAQILLSLILVVVAIPAFLCGSLVFNMWSRQIIAQLLAPPITPVITIPMIVIGLVGLALLIVPLFVSLRLAFVSQLVVLEQMGPAKSIAQSWQLSSGHSWRLLRLGIVMLLLQFIAVTLPTSVLSQIFIFTSNGNTLGWLIGAVITRLSDIVVFPFSIIVYTLLFYSLSIQFMQGDGDQPVQDCPFMLPDDTSSYDATQRTPST